MKENKNPNDVFCKKSVNPKTIQRNFIPEIFIGFRYFLQLVKKFNLTPFCERLFKSRVKYLNFEFIRSRLVGEKKIFQLIKKDKSLFFKNPVSPVLLFLFQFNSKFVGTV